MTMASVHVAARGIKSVPDFAMPGDWACGPPAAAISERTIRERKGLRCAHGHAAPFGGAVPSGQRFCAR